MGAVAATGSKLSSFRFFAGRVPTVYSKGTFTGCCKDSTRDLGLFGFGLGL